MNPRTAAFAGIVLALTLAACGGGDGGSSGSPRDDVGSTNLPNRDDASAMHITIEGGDCDQPKRPTKCNVLVGTSFTLSVNASVAPANGYILVATYVDFGDDLIYGPAEKPGDEVVWPECEPAVLISGQDNPEVVNHGCISGLTEPVASMYVGILVDLSFTCSSEPSSTLVDLLPYNDPVAGTSGTLFVEFGSNSQIVPELGNLTIDCVPLAQN